jgi:hypothetical protein
MISQLLFFRHERRQVHLLADVMRASLASARREDIGEFEDVEGFGILMFDREEKTSTLE